MMRSCAFGLLVMLSLTTPGFSDPTTPYKPPHGTLRLHVISADKSYGLFFIAATDTLCPFLRYRVSVAGRSLVTPVLRPGEAITIAVGQDITPDIYEIDAKSVGCRADLVALRGVVLRKASPDHGARALAARAAGNQRQPTIGSRPAPA